MKYPIILLAIIGFGLIWYAGQVDDDLTTEFIHKGDGVTYADPRPLNQGG